MLTAISATERVASHSSTVPDRNATRSADMVVRRWSSPSSRTFSAGPCSRPSARNVGRPAIRSSSWAESVVMVCSVRSALPLVSSPMRIMNAGMSGSVTTTMIAEVRSWNAMTTTVIGVSVTASSRAGTYPVRYSDSPPSPRVSTVAISSRRGSSSRGGSRVAAASTSCSSSATTRLAERCANRDCTHVTRVRTVTAPARTSNSVRHSPSSAVPVVSTPARTAPIASADTTIIATLIVAVTRVSTR